MFTSPEDSEAEGAIEDDRYFKARCEEIFQPVEDAYHPTRALAPTTESAFPRTLIAQVLAADV